MGNWVESLWRRGSQHLGLCYQMLPAWQQRRALGIDWELLEQAEGNSLNPLGELELAAPLSHTRASAGTEAVLVQPNQE